MILSYFTINNNGMILDSRGHIICITIRCEHSTPKLTPFNHYDLKIDETFVNTA